MSTQDKDRFKDLFEKLDVNKDGRVEVSELAAALGKLKGVSEKDVAGHAEVHPIHGVPC